MPAALDEILADPGAAGADTLELDLTHAWRVVPAEHFERVFANAARGRLGLALELGETRLWRAPTEAIASNRSFARERDRFLAEQGLDLAGFLAAGGRIRAFAARQLLLELGPRPRCVSLFRGNRVVLPETVAPEAAMATLDATVEGLVGWLLGNLGSDGRLPYKYWPSRGVESEADNTVRRFMATRALTAAGRALGRADLLRAAERNLAFNLDRFYREAEGPGGVRLGAIDWQGTVKLGAVALAALAIHEHPARDRFADPLARLSATVEALWREDGGFRTFLFPPARNDNQNFYPGEALLFWSHLLAERDDAELRRRCLASVAHYRDRHRRRRNPAFVPWHSQACARLFRLTGEPTLRDFVFEMNDWLLPLQQWGPPLDADLWGRFYAPGRPDYGPPHASSTGAYVEGLAAALELAVEAGDADRRRAYARAIRRALRSLRQLQVRDEVEAFYISRRRRAMGGMRREVYDNEIRIDNVQHALMGLLAARDLLAAEAAGDPT